MDRAVKFGLLATIASLLLIFTTVQAHATLVIGELSSQPFVPQAGEPFAVLIEMSDPTGLAVEDAFVLAEFRLTGSEDLVQVQFEESETPGLYETEVTLSRDGEYNLFLRDQTFRQEEATASLDVSLGSGPMFRPGESTIVFPPTATGANSLRTWLIWLIAIPIVAGIIVTILVLMNTREKDELESEL